MQTEKISKTEIAKQFAAIMKKRVNPAPVDRPQPLLEGDTAVFAIGEKQKLDNILIYHPEQTLNDGTKINEYFSLKTVDGREVTQSQICGRSGNGSNLAGNTPNERFQTLCEMLADGAAVSFKVKAVRILPATNPAYNNQRIYTWEKA